jgi:hypothetical protein
LYWAKPPEQKNMTSVLEFKKTNPYLWGLGAVIGAGLFLYANHLTIAAHFNPVEPAAVGNFGLGHAPSIAGTGSLDTLEW